MDVRCRLCGRTVRIPAASALIYACVDQGKPGFIAFTCPACGQPSTTKATIDLVCRMRAGGGAVITYRWEPELDDPARAVTSPLDEDELIEFGRRMEAL